MITLLCMEKNKTMSKAEDLSKQYREFRKQCGIKDPVMLDEIEEAYFEGYHQAEKDLELSWEDVYIIINAFLDYKIEIGNKWQTDKRYCEEVLKRFKEQRNEDKNV